MMVVDQEKELKDNCKIIPSEALKLTMPLHVLIDEEINNKTFYISSKLERTCADVCHCGVYSDLVKEKKLKESLYKKASVLPRESLVSCANKTAKWFCSSELLKILKSQIIDEPLNAL